MKLKIKAKPEDFIVEEITNLPLSKEGQFNVYLLTKRNWNTADLLRELSKKLRIPSYYFSYGGKKDRYGLTSQYISIKGAQIPFLEEKNYSLKFVGLMQQPMAPSLIKGNRFEITLRSLRETDICAAMLEIEAIKKEGFPNFFDDQRMGSFDVKQGFFAEKVLKGQYNGALKIYLTSIHPADNREKKERRRFFFEHWKDWDTCLKKAKTDFERQAVVFLSKNPNKFLDVLKQISHEELTVYFSCYQSYLWNEILRRVLLSKVGTALRKYPGLAGEYLFYSAVNPEELRYLNELHIPVPGTKPIMPDDFIGGLYAQVLEENGIKQPMFNKLKLRRAFFKSFPRKAIVMPEGMKAAIFDDELYPARKKLQLKFILQRGSYATMLVKMIFST